MIQSMHNFSNISSVYQVSNKNAYGGADTPVSAIGRLQNNYFNNQISAQDMSFIKGISNSMSTLYSSSSKLNSLKGSGKEDAEDIKKYTEQFVKDFNSTLDTLDEKSGKNNTINRLQDSLSSVGKVNKHTLEEIGINVGDNGKLTIDEKKFNESLENNLAKVKDTLATVGKKTKDVAMRGMNTSAEDLLKDKTNKLQNMMSEEDYHAGIRYMARNQQFMSFYRSAEAMLNMYV